MPPIKKISLVDQVYKTLRWDIISLRLPLGSRLNVNELQGALGVSCTPIREALNRLQLEGLVTNETNVGVRVLALDDHDVKEIQELAMTLHCAAIRLSMERGDCAALADDVEKYRREYLLADGVQSEVKAVNRLVGTFYRHCGNRRLDGSMLTLQGQQLLLRFIYAQSRREPKSGKDFEPLKYAVRGGDTEGACVALQAYTDAATPVILDYVRENGGGR